MSKKITVQCDCKSRMYKKGMATPCGFRTHNLSVKSRTRCRCANGVSKPAGKNAPAKTSINYMCLGTRTWQRDPASANAANWLCFTCAKEAGGFCMKECVKVGTAYGDLRRRPKRNCPVLTCPTHRQRTLLRRDQASDELRRASAPPPPPPFAWTTWTTKTYPRNTMNMTKITQQQRQPNPHGGQSPSRFNKKLPRRR